MPVAFITGITGQDGSYLAEYLLEKKEYVIYGFIRRSSNERHLDRLKSCLGKVYLRQGDMTDPNSMLATLTEIYTKHPTERVEIYNLAAMSDVGISFQTPSIALSIDTCGLLNLLEMVLRLGHLERTRIYQASTSEMFGKVLEVPQNEKTPFNPQSPYAISKMAAHQLVGYYRQAYPMYACCGILFNHESQRRGAQFVTRKITKAVQKIVCGCRQTILLGNLDAKRDWGHARDYVRAMHAMLQQEIPKDYVIATGQQKSVREFVTICFNRVGIDIIWSGSGTDEIATRKGTDDVLVKVSKEHFRPCEVETLLGDASLAKRELQWAPTTTFNELVEEMLTADKCCCFIDRVQERYLLHTGTLNP